MSCWKLVALLSRYQVFATQVFSCLLFAGWFFIEPGPEPVVAFVLSCLGAFLSYRETTSTWRNLIFGRLYEIHFRGQPEFTSKIPGYILGQGFCTKWKTHCLDGEFNTLMLDVIDEIALETIQAVVHDCQCKLYWIKIDGNVSWESEP